MWLWQIAAEDIRNMTKRIPIKQKLIARDTVSSFFFNISEETRCTLNKAMKYIKLSIQNDLGKCTILPVIQKTATVKICQEGLYLIVRIHFVYKFVLFWLLISICSRHTGCLYHLPAFLWSYVYFLVAGY